MRIEKGYLSICLALTLAGQVLLAQVNLGDILRRRPVNPRVPNPGVGIPGRSLPGAGVSADKCKALVAWMSILEREYPQVDFRLTVVDRLYPRAVNLFRDEHFAPFYGKPFAQTTDTERRTYVQTVFRACGPNQLTPQEQTTFQKLRIIVERPFILPAGSFSYQEVAAGVAERQGLVQWKDAALRDLTTLSASFEGFDKLEGYRNKGRTDLEKLWPSEQQQFLQAIEERRKTILPGLANQLTQAAAAIEPGIEGAKQIRVLRASYDRYLQVLDPAAKAGLNARLDELTAAAIRGVLAQQEAKLARLPAGIDGALGILDWRRNFDLELAGVNPTPELQALLAKAQARRRECLAQGMAEFKTLATQYPKPGRNGRKADDLLAKLFPAEEAPMPESAEYRAALDARTNQLKAEEQAKEARNRAAKAPPAKSAPVAGSPQTHPCDALAGHPGDPGHQGNGVADEELVSAEAIKQCSLAVRQQPKNARFRFQLGRAYWVAKQYDKAVESLVAAEELKYAPACHYLGLAYEQGRIKGEKADPEFARDLYQMAAAEGFHADAADVGPPAPVVEKAEDLDVSVFKEPTWVRALFSGNMDTLNRNRTQMLNYARGMQSFISLDPNEYDPTCLKLMDPSLDEKLDFEQTGLGDGKMDLNTAFSELKRVMSAGPRMIVAEAQRNEQTTQNGVDDMNVLSEDYGSCAGPVVQRVYGNLRRFVREKPSPNSTRQ